LSHPDSFCSVAEVAPDAETLTSIRRHLHAHPELSHQEAQTAALVASKLAAWGYAVTTGIGGHGVVGTLRVGDGSRSIGIRADMDALPIHEQTGLPYASRHAGTMHACGHDGHSATLLGAAQHLARTRRFAGTVHLIFQPAEEAGSNSGAERMIADGLFERFPCDAVYGLHNHPGVPTGTFLFRSGPFMAACDTVNITIHGKSGHAARPHLSVDPVMIASALVLALQTIVSRNVDPAETAVVTVGSLHAGDAPNAIPEMATLGISVRSFNPEVRQLLETRIRQLAQSHAQAHGARVTIEYVRGYPVLINSERETALARQVAEELVGPSAVVASFPMIAGSEDFAFFLQQRPGCFLRLGNGENAPMLHSAQYDYADDNLVVGAAFWTRLVERFLASGTA
jgi:hippurate hydrolase